MNPLIIFTAKKIGIITIKIATCTLFIVALNVFTDLGDLLK